MLNYNNDLEYRSCLRDVMKMSCNVDVSNNDLDEITKDETNFDITAITHFLDNVYLQTSHIDEFRDLYILAASCMFSEDPTIGLAVLFSYDYFKYFYPCLSNYLATLEFDDNYSILTKKFCTSVNNNV